jgi:predicted dinucleotide-binding enzyme
VAIVNRRRPHSLHALAQELGPRELGFAAVDTGRLTEGGRRQQPGSPIYAADLTGNAARTVLG